MSRLKSVYRYFLLFITAAFIYLSFNANRNDYMGSNQYDGNGYYLYLPHTIIYHSFKEIPGHKESGGIADKTSGLIFDKYTYGPALMILPFFMASHTIALLSGKDADGFSQVYGAGNMMAAVFYLCLGIYFIIKLLTDRYKPHIVILSILGLVCGTSLYYYALTVPLMSHVYTFCLVSIFIWLCQAFTARSSWGRALLLAVVFGLIFLIRPSNGIIIFYLLLCNVYSLADLKNRWQWIRQNFAKLLLLPLFCILLFLPQLIYWHSVTGQWMLYSYKHDTWTESFIYWARPKVLHVLLSPQNGFFIYAPVMLFFIPGLVSGLRQRIFSSPAILAVICLAVYEFASWWCWWYGGAFGHRAFIDFLPLLVFPLAQALRMVWRQKQWIRYSLLAVYVLCMVYTVKLSYIYCFPWEGAGWGWQSLGNKIIQISMF